ncbi:hypothetical protein H8356DRAFT_1295320 [Neocallimastix lanati (nom. inval.)]|nr:hypothetical protein H8356DRAFT_1295320 [Neocallimastix sp. JGI-2020a]
MAAPTYDLDSKVNKDEIKDLIDEENENEELEEKIFNFFKNDTLNNPKFWKDFMTYFAIPFIQGAFYGLGEFVAHATKRNKDFKVNSRNNTEPVAVAMGVDKGIYEQLVFQTVMEQSNKMMKNNNQNIDNTKNPKIIRKEEIFGLKDLINTENKNNLVIRRNYLF